MKFLRIIVALLGSAVLVSGQIVYKAPARAAAAPAANLTNVVINDTATAVSSSATTNTTRTWSGTPAAISLLIAVTNGTPYLTVGFKPLFTNTAWIVGTTNVGRTLTGYDGGGFSVPTGSYSYSWYTNSVLVDGETNITLGLTSAFLNSTVAFRSVASNLFGVTTNTSSGVGPIGPQLKYVVVRDDLSWSAGSGYTVEDVLTADGGTPVADPVRVVVTSVADGVITSFTVSNAWYLESSLPGTPNNFTGGTGSGFSVELSYADE